LYSSLILYFPSLPTLILFIMGPGGGTVVKPIPTRRRPPTPTAIKNKDDKDKPPAKRQRQQQQQTQQSRTHRPGAKKVGRPKKIIPPPKITGLSALPAEIIGRIASFLLPPAINVDDGFLPPWELPYRAARTKSAQAKVKEFRYGGIPSGVRDVLNLARTCKRVDSGVGLVVGKIGDGRTDGNKRYV
jgi:hypothetical protein